VEEFFWLPNELIHQLMRHMSEQDLGELNRLLVKARKAE
jgi:hypothetical protein